MAVTIELIEVTYERLKGPPTSSTLIQYMILNVNYMAYLELGAYHPQQWTRNASKVTHGSLSLSDNTKPLEHVLVSRSIPQKICAP